MNAGLLLKLFIGFNTACGLFFLTDRFVKPIDRAETVLRVDSYSVPGKRRSHNIYFVTTNMQKIFVPRKAFNMLSEGDKVRVRMTAFMRVRYQLDSSGERFYLNWIYCQHGFLAWLIVFTGVCVFIFQRMPNLAWTLIILNTLVITFAFIEVFDHIMATYLIWQ